MNPTKGKFDTTLSFYIKHKKPTHYIHTLLAEWKNLLLRNNSRRILIIFIFLTTHKSVRNTSSHSLFPTFIASYASYFYIFIALPITINAIEQCIYI